MRISTDPTDPAYIDARPRKAWCNDVEVDGWIVADEFRRCVITAAGKVLQGSVRIERLADEPAELPQAPSEPPIHTGFSGVFVNVPEAKPAEEVFTPPPASVKRRR